ncbi:hypothetical protein HY387_00970 [Candidatus Daviesbacteria bacterium]|nr:hypothetical protein [Candidatus Daviesbacteria bacterium]
MVTERFGRLKETGLAQELDRLRDEESNPESAWLRFQQILNGKIEGFPDRFIEVLGPVERIFKIRMIVFSGQASPREANDLVVSELSSVDGPQRSLLEEILPAVTHTFNTSRNIEGLRMRRSRRYH